MGQRINELCDHYHEQNRSGTKGTIKLWPRGPHANGSDKLESNDNDLCDFIESQENSTPKIDKFKKKIGLKYISKYAASPNGYLIPERKVDPPKQIAFLVDYSNSMKGTKIRNAIQNVEKILESPDYFQDEDYISFARFDSEVNQVFPMLKKESNLDSMLKKIIKCRDYVNGGTKFYDALNATISQFSNDDKTKWIISLTDGESFRDKISMNDCISNLKSSNINLFIIGFDVDASVAQTLQINCELVQSAGLFGNYINASNSGDSLASAFNNIAMLISSPTLLT
jgi:uncharacterized protein YegL